MNAPVNALFTLAAARLRDLVVVCPDGDFPTLEGRVLLPRYIAEEQMERFWQGVLPPKPKTPPRLLCVQAAVGSPLELPPGVVKGPAVKASELLNWLTSPTCPPGVWAGPEDCAALTSPGLSGKPTEAERLTRCFGFLSMRGYDGLDVPLNGKRGSHGLVPFSPAQLRIQGDSVDIVRDFDACLGYSWLRQHLTPEERQRVSTKLFCS